MDNQKSVIKDVVYPEKKCFWNTLMIPFRKADDFLAKLFKKIDSFKIRSDFWQMILLLIFGVALVGLITIRDLFFIGISKYVFIAFFLLFLPILRRDYIIYALAFTIPFWHALPNNWIVLIFILYILISNRFRLNLAQFVFPIIIAAMELLLTFLCGSNFYFEVFSYFLYSFLAAYLLLDRHLQIKKKIMVYSFVAGALAMCLLCISAQIEMLVITSNVVSLPFTQLLFDPFVRLENVVMFNEWTTMIGCQFTFMTPDMSVGDDPNNMAYFLIVATALLLYVTSAKKSSYWSTFGILFIIGVLGFFTKSRSFMIAFPLLLLIWYIYSLICKRFKLISLLYVSCGLIILASGYLVLDSFYNLTNSIFGRFSVSSADGRISLIFDYLNFMFSHPLIASFGSGVLNTTFVTGFEVTSHTALIQIFFSYGIIGTFLIFIPIAFYIIYVRLSGRKRDVDLTSLLPIFAVFFFTLALQILAPFLLMLPAVICCMAINDYSTIQQKPFSKFSLLTDIKFLGSQGDEKVDLYDGRDLDNHFSKNSISQKMAKEEEMSDRTPVISKNDVESVQKSEEVEMVAKPRVNRLAKMIDSLFDKIARIKFLNNEIFQNIVFGVYIALISAFLLVSVIFGYEFLKTMFLILIGAVTCLLDRKRIIYAFMFMIPLSNCLPQRWLILFFFAVFIIKSRFRLNIGHLLFAGLFITFELLDCFLFGFVDVSESFSFLLIVSFVIYVSFDRTFKANLPMCCISFLVGLFFMAILYIGPLIVFGNRALSEATQNQESNIFNIIFDNHCRIGQYKTYFEYLNTFFKPVNQLVESNAPTYFDDPNNVGLFCIIGFACISRLINKKWYTWLIAGILFIFVLFIGMMTKSRSFFISFALLLVLLYAFAIASKKLSKRGAVIIFTIFASIIGVFALIDREFNFLSYIIEKKDVSSNTFMLRLDLIQQYISAMFTNQKYLLTGTGLLNEATALGIETYPHTSVVQVFVSYGILGFISVSLLFCFLIYSRIRNKDFSLYNLAPLITVFVYSLALQVLMPYELMFPFFVALLMINSFNRISSPKDKVSAFLYMSLWPYSRPFLKKKPKEPTQHKVLKEPKANNLSSVKNIKKAFVMKPSTIFFTNIILWIFLVLLAYFVENAAVFAFPFTRSFSVVECSCLFIGLIALGACYIFFEKKYNGFQLSKKELLFGIVLLSLLTINIIVILTAPDASINEFVAPSGITYFAIYEISIAQRIYYCLAAVIAFAVPFIIVCILPRKFYSFSQFNILYYACLIVAGLSIIFSLIFEFDNYILFFTKFSSTQSSEYAIQSFFFNRNIYGLFLFICIFICAYLNCRKHHWYYYLMMAVLLLFMFFTLVKTTLALSIAFVFIYCVIRIIATFKENVKRNAVISSIIGVVIIAGIGVLIYSYYVSAPILIKIKTLFDRLFIDVGQSTFASRTVIWNYSFLIIGDIPHFIFGRGIGVFDSSLYAMTSSDPNVLDITSFAHNSAVDLLGKGGILYLLLYLALMVYGIYSLFKMAKYHRSLALTSLLFVFMILVAGVLECWYFFSFNISNILLTILVFVPALSFNYQQEHKERLSSGVQPRLNLPFKDVVKKPYSLTHILTLLGPVIGFAIGSLSFFVNYWNFSIISLILILAQVVLLFGAIFPFAFYVYHSHQKKDIHDIKCFMFYAISLASILIISTLLSLIPGIVEPISLVILFVVTCIVYYSIMMIFAFPFFPFYRLIDRVDAFVQKIFAKQIANDAKETRNQ